MELHYFQKQANSEILAARDLGFKSAMLVMPTGSGKTVTFSGLTRDLGIPTVIAAHRREIVSQIALTLGRMGVGHNIIAPKAIVREVMEVQRDKLKRSWITPKASVFVASVPTLNARADKMPAAWFRSILMYVQDEAHHMLADNNFGRAAAMFPNAFQLGVTATPSRADGRGLGAHCGGIYQTLIRGPIGRRLINEGYLSDYTLYAPENCFNVENVPVTGSGDFSKPKLALAAEENFVVGDVVQHYKQLANGLKTIAFMPDIKTSNRMELKFREAGIAAMHVDGETNIKARSGAIRDFENGRLSVMLNVDLFGEGFDVPDVECVILGRPTWSYGLLSQQIGRALRKGGRARSTIVDPVGNIMRHKERGLPDAPKVPWSLDGCKARNIDGDGPPLRICGGCMRAFESYTLDCPYCGYRPERRAPARDITQVEGNLMELSPDVLESLRSDAARLSADASGAADGMRAQGASEIAVRGFLAKHRDRKAAQTRLQYAMSLWGGREKAEGLGHEARYIKFFRKFGTDVLSAQTLGRRPAEELTNRIKEDLDNEYKI